MAAFPAANKTRAPVSAAGGVVDPFKTSPLGTSLGRGMTAAGGWGKEGPYPFPPINRIRNHFDIASIAATEIKISTIAYAT